MCSVTTSILPVLPSPSENEISVEYCGEWFTPTRSEPFVIGREGDLDLDDNPFLHRRFLEVGFGDGLWWLVNVGSRLTATITDGSGGVQAWLGPGSRLPIVFGYTVVIFTAGPTTYELSIHSASPAFQTTASTRPMTGSTTVGGIALTPSQRLLIVALAEPLLRRDGTGTSDIPSSASAAARLGWLTTRFNRKLDNVCEKLDRVGVRGVRGGPGALATNRRARLVEYAVSTQLVTRGDLALLDQPPTDEDD
ncbi:hypothetical protein HQQ80_11710 [Microbacteriaceae bacterium VKM Ac-2855]|nr:hypothetical protein [Microbacteriaceae bacterium VKM Ac-2855]